MDTLWNGEAMVRFIEVSEPVIHHTAAILIISLLSVIGAWAIRIWRDRRYGVFVRIVSAWVEDPQPGAYPSFQYKTLWQGRALDLFHRHCVSQDRRRTVRCTQLEGRDRQAGARDRGQPDFDAVCRRVAGQSGARQRR